MRTWKFGTSFSRLVEFADEDTPRSLYGLSPPCTEMVTVHNSPPRLLCVEDTKYEALPTMLPLEYDDLRSGGVYDLTFDSDTRFHLKIDGPGWHVQTPYDIISSQSDEYSRTFTIIKGEPVPLPEPRATPPYTLDANHEWVLDGRSAGSRQETFGGEKVVISGLVPPWSWSGVMVL